MRPHGISLLIFTDYFVKCCFKRLPDSKTKKLPVRGFEFYFARILGSQWRLPRKFWCPGVEWGKIPFPYSPSVSFNNPAVCQKGVWAGYMGHRDIWAVIQSREKRCYEVPPSSTSVLGIREEIGSLSFQPAVIGVVVYLTLMILPVLEEQGSRGLCVAGNSALWVPETRWIQLVQSTFLETPFRR